MKKLFLALTMIMVATAAEAKTVVAHVNGLVCAFCATAIENSLKEEPGVKSTKVDLETKLVTIDYVDGKEPDDKYLTNLLSEAGYTVTKIDR